MNKKEKVKDFNDFERSISDRINLINELYALKEGIVFFRNLKNENLNLYTYQAIKSSNKFSISYLFINLFKLTSASDSDVNSIEILINELEKKEFITFFKREPDVNFIKSEYAKISKEQKTIIYCQRSKFYAHLDSFSERISVYNDDTISISYNELYEIINILSGIVFYVAKYFTEEFEKYTGRIENVYFLESEGKINYNKLDKNVDLLYFKSIINDDLDNIFNINPNANYKEEKDKLIIKYRQYFEKHVSEKNAQ